jgi:putative hydrolase of the HAD superfamily
MMIGQSVKAVLFDAVGTLIYADPPVRAVYAAAASDFGVSLDEEAVERRFLKAFRKYNLAATGEMTTSELAERDRWRAIVTSVFPEIAPCDAIFQRLWNHFAMPTSWRLYGDVTDCWRRLSDAGLQVGIASNFDQRLLGICHGLHPLDQFKHVFTSSRLGWRKPATQFFRAIETATDLKPNQLLLVGDDWDSDYLGATAAGWQAVHLNRASNTLDAAIGSLAEIV